MELIATWTSGQDPSVEDPYAVRWIDGTPATLDDYRRHSLDTHTFLPYAGDAIELRMFPGVVAEVRYDEADGHWMVNGPGVSPATLDLTDPNALNEQIIAELYTFPVVYRANIKR